ncbi:autotransporter-associated beta strand repeat-containing protein, partial [Brucella rhizosphaerae]|uniref:autotransporter-associated beta strand repeat-containing protein n=1 Tax=Brucella rhizosphaerae TaxID=571254 RepID=UPI001ABF57FC
MPDNQVVLLLPIARNSRRTRVLSHSVSPLAILRTTGRAAGVAVTSLMMLGLMAQLSGFAMATDYTTTQTTSLLDGDTIATTRANTAGYGVWSKVGTTLEIPGNNTITTTGTGAYGVNTSGTGSGALSRGGGANITGATIATKGVDAFGIAVTNSVLGVNLVGVTVSSSAATAVDVYSNASDKDNPLYQFESNMTADNTTKIHSDGDVALNIYGVFAAAKANLDGTQVSATGSGNSAIRLIGNTQLTISGSAYIETIGDNAHAINNESYNANTIISDGVSISTKGNISYGIQTYAAMTVGAANVSTNGEGSGAVQVLGAVTATLTGTQLVTRGGNAAAASAGGHSSPNSKNALISLNGASLTTTGDGSNAVQIYGSTNTITMDGATTLSTSGVGSHAISVQGAGTKTFDGVNPVTNSLSEHISVSGRDAAAFNATGTGSVLKLDGIYHDGMVTLGADSWTAIAENGGTIDFANIASGIKSIWAKGSDANTIGTIVISGQSASLGDIRARVDANGLFVLSGLDAGANFAIASLEGDGGNVDLGTTNLTISGDAKTSYAGTFEGTGAFIRGDKSGNGLGSTTLTGDNSAYTRAVSVTGGSLYVDGQIGGAATVTGGTLGGSGTIGGDVSVAAGGNLAGRQGQVLTIQGNLALDAGSTTTVALGAPEEATASGLFNVAGDVTLAGKLNVTDLGGFGPGLYRLIDYGGTLSDNGMTINDVPDGLDATQMSIQTNVASEVNLINRSGADLNFWDGSNMANHGNGAIDGGTGTWKKGETNWTDTDGTLHGNWSDGQFAMFTGTAGTVTVDNSGGDIVVDGMQFAVDGYRVEGDAVTLQDGEAIIRVGVGNGSGKGMSATIASELKGTGSLNKQDYGTLILTADNSYAGGTTISEGTLQLGDGGTAGSVQGDILNNATLAVNRSDAYKLSGKISGSGALAQNGTGTLILTGDNSYTGGTTISAGTLQLGDGGTSGSISGTISNDGILAVNRSDKLVLDGSVGGTGALQQNGTGTTVLAADNSYSGGTTINAGTLQLGNGGTTGSIAGDVANNGTLSFNRSDQLIFSKAISGTGSVTQDGAGTTLMTGANTYSGATRVNAGTLQQKMSGSFSAASDYTVAANATLDNGGYKTTLASLNNSGTVNFGTNPGAVVNVAGNYTGNGGMLVLNTVLGDDSS